MGTMRLSQAVVLDDTTSRNAPSFTRAVDTAGLAADADDDRFHGWGSSVGQGWDP